MAFWRKLLTVAALVATIVGVTFIVQQRWLPSATALCVANAALWMRGLHSQPKES